MVAENAAANVIHNAVAHEDQQHLAAVVHHSAGDRPSRGLLLDRVSASGKSQARNAQDEDGGDADRKTGHQAENSLKWLSLQRDRRH